MKVTILTIAVASAFSWFSMDSSFTYLTEMECRRLVGATYGSFYTCGSTPTPCPGCTAHSCTLTADFWGNRYCLQDGSMGCSTSWASKFTCVWNGLFDWTICDDTFGNNVCGNQRLPIACGVPFRNPNTLLWACPAPAGCGAGGGAVAPCNGCM